MPIGIRPALDRFIIGEGAKVPAAYNGMSFSKQPSENYLRISEAIKYAAERDGVLPSVPELNVICVEDDGKSGIVNLNDYHILRTVQFYVPGEKGFLLGVCNSANPDVNIILKRPDAAQLAFASGIWRLKPASDADARRMVEFVRETKGLTALPSTRRPYRVALEALTSDPVSLQFHEDTAGARAAYLRGRARTLDAFYLLLDKQLKEVGSDEIGVWPVGLGNDNYLYSVDADGNIYNIGRSRPMAR